MNKISLDKLPKANASGAGNAPRKTSASQIIKIISAVLMLLYICWPADLLNDWIPVLGWIDDVIAGIGMAITLFSAIKTGRYDPNVRMEQRAKDIFGDDNF